MLPSDFLTHLIGLVANQTHLANFSLISNGLQFNDDISGRGRRILAYRLYISATFEWTMHRMPDGVRSTHGPDGGIVLDIRHGQVFYLNLVGSRILELLKGGQSEAGIAEKIRSDFGVGAEAAEVDVREFLQVLKEHKLIEEPAA